MSLPWKPLLLSFASAALLNGAEERISYNRQIRPLLSDQCFTCHGPDANKRKARLRLDIREEALKPAKSDAIAIVPGKPDESELITRIFETEEDEIMPPPKTHKSLSKEQKNMIRQWIAEGAEYEAHWAYLPVNKPPVDVAAGNPIDTLVAARQKSLGLAASEEAVKRTLIRRLYTDLHDLPAPPAEVDAFVKDTTPDRTWRLLTTSRSLPKWTASRCRKA